MGGRAVWRVVGSGESRRAREFEVAEDACGGAADGGWVVCSCEHSVEGTQGAFAAFVVFQHVDGVDPCADCGLRQFGDGVEVVFAQFGGEVFDVLIDVEKHGDQAARFLCEGRQIGE